MWVAPSASIPAFLPGKLELRLPERVSHNQAPAGTPGSALSPAGREVRALLPLGQRTAEVA